MAHQKFLLIVFIFPPYKNTVWHYKGTNAHLIRKTIDQFGKNICFSHLIFINFTAQEKVICKTEP